MTAWAPFLCFWLVLEFSTYRERVMRSNTRQILSAATTEKGLIIACADIWIIRLEWLQKSGAVVQFSAWLNVTSWACLVESSSSFCTQSRRSTWIKFSCGFSHHAMLCGVGVNGQIDLSCCTNSCKDLSAENMSHFVLRQRKHCRCSTVATIFS